MNLVDDPCDDGKVGDKIYTFVKGELTCDCCVSLRFLIIGVIIGGIIF